MLKKILIFCLIVGFCSTTLSYPIYAQQDANYSEKVKQAKIDELFINMNETLSERKSLEQVAARISSIDLTDNLSSQVNKDIAKYIDKETVLENEILSLGLKKIDPNNVSDMEQLRELFNSASNQNEKLASVPSPPDLAAIASVYTLYRYQGTYTYQGTTYNYSYIRVVDNKGYNKLYKLQIFDAAPKNATQAVIRSVLGYTFNYVFSSLLTRNPIGVAADWTMGAVLAGLNSYNTSLITGTNESLYRININSVTLMTYYWIHYNNDWKFMGSDGDFTVTHTDYSAFNYNGSPVQLYTNPPRTWTSTNSHIWFNYVENFHNNRHLLPYYQQINPIGSFQVKGFNSTVTFTPVFAPMPNDLI